MIIKFVKDHQTSGRKVGDVWDTEEPIARAYIAAGVAVEHKEAETDLLAAARAEIARGFEVLQANLTEQVGSLGRTIGSGLSQVGTGRGFRPRMDATESEDEKISRTGGFRNLAHFSLELQRSGGQTPGLHRGDTPLGKYNSARSTASTSAGPSAARTGCTRPASRTAEHWSRRISRPRSGSGSTARRSCCPARRVTRSAAIRSPCPANAETSPRRRLPVGRRARLLGGRGSAAHGQPAEVPQSESAAEKADGLSFVTNELLTDSATALEQYLGRVVPQEIEFKIHDGLINGTAPAFRWDCSTTPR